MEANELVWPNSMRSAEVKMYIDTIMKFDQK